MCARAGKVVRLRGLFMPVLIAVLCGLSPQVGTASESDETPLLRRIPDLAEGLKRLPPFLRDTELQLQSSATSSSTTCSIRHSGRSITRYAFHRDLVLTVAGQYTDQRAVGDALLGGSKFKNWVTTVGSMRAQLHYHDFTLTTAFSVTGKGNNLHTPFGQYPGFLHMLIRDFDRAGEVAWMAGAGYDLSRWVADTRIGVNLAQGTNAISPAKRTAAPDIREYDFGVDHRASKHSGLHGFGFTAIAGIVDVQGTNRPQYQIRLILNYELPLL